MKIGISVLLSIVLISCSALKKTNTSVYSSQIFADVETLSSDEMEGRETGKKGERMAAKYIAERFEKLGLKPMGNTERNDLNAYFQDFTAYESTDPHGMSDMPDDKIPVKARNVVGFIDHGAAYTVVIGGHYDHLGYGGFGSLYTGDAEIHNGADDNASGIAGMLYMAEVLKGAKYDDSNYLFIAFSGEEKGLWGSNYWTKNPTFPIEQLNFMINFDMIGRLEDNKLAVNGVGTSPAWSILDQVGKKYNLVKSESGIGPSDHSSFYLIDVPAIHFFTGQHEDYHRPSDDAELVNVQGIMEVSDLSLTLIEKLNKEKISFAKTKNEERTTTTFKVTLGVIPDYLYNERGMRIDGVREGKTADAAGLEKGDIVIKMGEYPVDDMQSYMKSLSKFEKGESIKVVVLRNGKEVEKEVTFL